MIMIKDPVLRKMKVRHLVVGKILRKNTKIFNEVEAILPDLKLKNLIKYDEGLRLKLLEAVNKLNVSAKICTTDNRFLVA